MNVKRFTARTSREAFALVRQAFGEDAVVLSTKPCAEGVEVLAMAPEAVNQLEKVASPSAPARAGRGDSLAARAERQQADRAGAAQRRLADRVPPEAMEGDVNEDVERMAMSTLSFQDYVRDRMLRRRQAALVLIIVTSVIILIMALGIPIVGTLYRMRYGYLMSIVGLGTAGWVMLFTSVFRVRLLRDENRR